MTTAISNFSANVEAEALLAHAANGYLELYNGTRPATADTAITTQTKVASLRFGSPAFGASSGGIATAAAITSDPDAVGGTATWCRITKSDHTTVLWDGSVGLSGSGADVILDAVVISAHAQVGVTGCTYTVPKS